MRVLPKYRAVYPLRCVRSANKMKRPAFEIKTSANANSVFGHEPEGSNIPIWAAEISPADIRGSWHLPLSDAFGISLGI